MSIFSTLLSICFPNRCVLCRKEGTPLCQACIREVPFTPYTPNRDTIAFFSYRQGGMKRVMWLFKYHGRTTLAEPLGEMLGDALTEELEERKTFENFTNPVLIPLPISKRRKKKRGYNQTTLIAEHFIASHKGAVTLCDDVLIKTKETKRQATRATKKDRLKNVVGSFTLAHPEKIQGKNVILFDDIITTGATLDEATRVLKQAHPRRILRVALLH